KDFHTLRYTFPSYTEISESGYRSFVVGPTVEFGLRHNWSVEIDALHRTLNYRVLRSDSSGHQACAPGDFCSGGVSTWQFPILAKYRIPFRTIQPFVAGGPAFRTHSNPVGSRPSSYGFTAGAGVDMNFGKVYFAPTVRYTRWGSDGPPFRPTVRDQ